MALTKTPYRVQPAYNEIVAADDTNESIQVIVNNGASVPYVGTLYSVRVGGSARFDLAGMLSNLFYAGRVPAQSGGIFPPWAFIDTELIIPYSLMDPIGFNLSSGYALNAVRQLGEHLDLIDNIESIFLTERKSDDGTEVRIPCYDGYPVGLSVMYHTDYELDTSEAIVITLEVTDGQNVVFPFFDDGNGGIIDYGDGQFGESHHTTAQSHIYATGGTYTVKFMPMVQGTAAITSANTSQFTTYRTSIRTVEVFSPRVTNTLFYECTGLQEVKGPIMYGGQMLEYMFSGCTGLVSVPSNFTVNLIELSRSLREMFYQCSSLQVIPAGVFSGCRLISSLQGIFRDCSSLLSLPSGLFPVQDAQLSVSAEQAFSGCRMLTSIPSDLFSQFTMLDTIRNVFSDCVMLSSIPYGLFSTSPGIVNASSAFSNCLALQSDPYYALRGLTSVTDVSSMFNSCSLLNWSYDIFRDNPNITNASSFNAGNTVMTSAPVGIWSYVPNITNISNFFRNWTALTTVDVNVFTSINGTRSINTDGLFYGCKSLNTVPSALMDSFTANTVFVNLFCFSGLGTLPAGLFSGCTALTRLTNNFQQTLIISIPKAFIDGLPQSLTSFSQLFTQMNNLRAVGEGAFDSASRVTDMSNVFSSSPQLVSVPRDLFRNCKSVTSFYQSFIYCSALRNQYTFRDGGTAVLTSADLILTDGTTIDLTAVQTEPWSMNTGDQVFIRGNGITLDNIDISYTYTTGGIRTVKLSAAVDPSQYGILRVVDTTNGFILESTQNTAWWWATGVIAVQLNAVDGFELWERAGKPGYPSTIVGTQCYTGTNMVPELGGTIPSGWR